MKKCLVVYTAENTIGEPSLNQEFFNTIEEGHDFIYNLNKQKAIKQKAILVIGDIELTIDRT